MIYILIALGLVGFLPMGIILFRKNRNDKFRKYGVTTTGTITELFGRSIRGINIVEIKYLVQETGETLSKNLRVAGVPYEVGTELPVIYDPKNPKRMQLDMRKGFIPMLIFTIIIGVVIIWACFKLNEMVARGEM